jgi:uncharacterized protein
MDLRNNKALTPIESGMPITNITLNVSRRCCLSCSYCFAHCFSEYDKVDMTLETAKKCVDWLLSPSTSGDASKVDIGFWGGEPLLKWDLIKEIVPYAEYKAGMVGKDISFGGTTNVVLLTEDKFDFMDEHNIRFLLSIDGTKEHHDKFRKFPNGNGSWDIIDKNSTAILKRWPNSQVRLSFTPENLDGFIDDLNYFYEKGFRDIVYSPVSEGDWTEERIAKLREVWMKVAEWYTQHEPIKMKFLDDACNQCLGNHQTGAPCGAGRQYVGIDYDGSIFSCHRFCKFDDPRPWYERELCLGHIDYGILNQQWRERFLNWKVEEIKNDCTGCRAKGISCTGGCWATNYDLNGDIAKISDMNCELSRIVLEQGEYLLNLIGPEKALRFKRFTEQGSPDRCVCYNVHDNLYGTANINLQDHKQCICDIAHYGRRPEIPFACPCYNSGNQGTGYYDRSGISCRPYYPATMQDLNDLQNKLNTLQKG